MVVLHVTKLWLDCEWQKYLESRYTVGILLSLNIHLLHRWKSVRFITLQMDCRVIDLSSQLEAGDVACPPSRGDCFFQQYKQNLRFIHVSRAPGHVVPRQSTYELISPTRRLLWVLLILALKNVCFRTPTVTDAPLPTTGADWGYPKRLIDCQTARKPFRAVAIGRDTVRTYVQTVTVATGGRVLYTVLERYY